MSEPYDSGIISFIYLFWSGDCYIISHGSHGEELIGGLRGMSENAANSDFSVLFSSNYL